MAKVTYTEGEAVEVLNHIMAIYTIDVIDGPNGWAEYTFTPRDTAAFEVEKGKTLCG